MGEENTERKIGWRGMLVLAWLLVFSFFFAIANIGGGCCNITTRGTRTATKPFWVARHPYYCTAAVWSDSICAPFKVMGTNGADGIWYSVATVTWPFWVVDEVFEVVGDTVFLPADATYLCLRNDNQRK